MKNRVLFSFNYESDVKSLSGFVKGGRDQVPKEVSSYHQGLISKWATGEIKDHIEEVASRSKEGLEISARNFQSPHYDEGSGSFECQYFIYDFVVSQSSDDPSKCSFDGTLSFENLDGITQVQNALDSCFDFSFETVFFRLPESNSDLKELIYTLDDNKKRLNEVFEFTYENDFSSFTLTHKEEKTEIKVNSSTVEVNFKNTESIFQMIDSLKEANEKVFSATSKEYRLLN
ncbi:MAG: hypothetical protein AB8E15_11775 [Bdellovibrionales bacterium]